MEQFASFARQSRVSAFKPVLAALAEGERLSRERAREALSLILEGAATPAQLGAFLMALRQRGETPEELIGAAQAMRAAMIRVEAPEDAIDIVGTGGDGASTYNISTLAAIIAAAAGVPVAKHGGKAASSRSGATDVLAELGVKVGIDAAAAGACLREAGICFMAAPTHHPALRHAAPVRSELGLRTIFNLLDLYAIPPESSARCWESTRRNGSSRWRWRCASLARSARGCCMGAMGSTRPRPPAKLMSSR